MADNEIRVHGLRSDTSHKRERCPYCLDGFAGRDEVHSCVQCQAKLHIECLEGFGHCPICKTEDPIVNQASTTEKIARQIRRKRAGEYEGARRNRVQEDLVLLKALEEEFKPTWKEYRIAAMSLIIPGLGQLRQGRILAALGWLTFAICFTPVLFGLWAWPLSYQNVLENFERRKRIKKQLQELGFKS